MKHLFLYAKSQTITVLSIVAVAVSGCGPREPAPNARQQGQQPGLSGAAVGDERGESPAADKERLSDERISSIREAVERCAGTLRRDAGGQPVEIDLAVGRGSADAAAMAAAVACPELRILRARAGQVEADELGEIRSLVKLEELMLHDAAIDDQFLNAIAEDVQGLKRLTLRNTPNITDRGIASLSKLPHLTQLALIDLQITSRALSSLATCPSLTVLDLRMCGNIESQGLAALVEKSTLKELKLGGYGIDDVALGTVSKLPSLESLTVEDAPIGSDGLEKLAESKTTADRIQILAFARCAGLSDESLQPLSKFPNLRRLTLRDVPVTGTFLQSLAAPERLELLSLNQTYLAEEAYAWIAACRNLKRLEVAGSYLTPGAVEKIATLTSLEYLNLTECGLNDDMLQSLEALPHLQTLIVEGNPDLSAEAIERIRQ
jgi:Leucine-rich repeat (LRR) protein